MDRLGSEPISTLHTQPVHPFIMEADTEACNVYLSTITAPQSLWMQFEINIYVSISISDCFTIYLDTNSPQRNLLQDFGEPLTFHQRFKISTGAQEIY